MPPFDADVLYKLAECINASHRDLSKSWHEANFDKAVNLKTTRIDHLVHDSKLMINPDFLAFIDMYHQFLFVETADIDFEFEFAEYDVRTRIKQKDSIVNKLIHYRKNDAIKNGATVPVNKCLNDIYGVRIVFDNLNHDDDDFNCTINKLIEKYKLKKLNKRSKEYRATHLYFKNGRNKYFPWELQIWSSIDAKRNEVSHEKHADKRKYTDWPEVYRNSLELERRDI